MNGSTMRSRKKSKDTLKQMAIRTQQTKSVEHWKSNPKRKIYSITGLSQKRRKTSNNDLNSHLKELEKEQQSPK